MNAPFAYYNECDEFAVEWLRALIAAGHIADGEVDSRPIQEVDVDDLNGFTQHHFFAGIGVWSYALRKAGWPDSRPVWTGSCPCQPFSASGKKKGFDDERHLWPVWANLIALYRPSVVFGEQVASKDSLSWFDLVSTDLEDQDYAVGAADLCVAGVGGPHIRQRLWWTAVALGDTESATRGLPVQQRETRLVVAESLRHGEVVQAVAYPAGERHDRRRTGQTSTEQIESERPCHVVGLGNTDSARPQGRWPERISADQLSAGASSLVGGHWAGADWLYCHDNKYRPVEPGTFPLVTGTPARVGRLRGYGNALCAEVATTFIEAYLDVERGVA